MAVAFSIATMATVRLPMSPRRLVSLPRVGLPAPSGLTMIMMADSTFLCAASSTLTNPKYKFCGNAQTGDRYYCIPRVYDPTASWLFHNNGDGTFTEVGHLSDIGKSMGKAWGVVAADINNDGWMDLWVANDTVANFLFVNRGQGRFEEVALQAGVGYSMDGRARSGMGVDAADYDQDGWTDLFVTNVDQEMYAFYHNNHDETFDDIAVPTHIGMVT